MLVQKLVVAQLGLSWEAWRGGSGAGFGGSAAEGALVKLSPGT